MSLFFEKSRCAIAHPTRTKRRLRVFGWAIRATRAIRPLQDPQLKRWQPIIGSLFALLLSSACVSKRQIPDDFRFTTHISEDGFKLFQLSYPPPRRTLSVGPTNPNAPRRSSSRYPERYVERMLRVALLNTGYCQEGFIQLGRYAGETSERIRGECKDKASQQDHLKFPNTLTRW